MYAHACHVRVHKPPLTHAHVHTDADPQERAQCLQLPGQGAPPRFPRTGAHSKSQKPKQRREQTCWDAVPAVGGQCAQAPSSHGAPPGPQAAGSPGQQAQPRAEHPQHYHGPGQQGHHSGRGENTGV